MEVDKASMKEFFVSKAFFSVVTILVSYFFGEDVSRMIGYGVSFGQELASTGVLSGVALLLYSNFGRVKTKAELRKQITAARLNAAEAERQRKTDLAEKKAEIVDLKSRIPKRGDGGKFAPRIKSKPK